MEGEYRLVREDTTFENRVNYQSKLREPIAIQIGSSHLKIESQIQVDEWDLKEDLGNLVDSIQIIGKDDGVQVLKIADRMFYDVDDGEYNNEVDLNEIHEAVNECKKRKKSFEDVIEYLGDSLCIADDSDPDDEPDGLPPELVKKSPEED